MAGNPLLNKDIPLTKERLEDYLGLGRYRRFESIYDELVDIRKMTAKTFWSTQDNSWFYGFFKGGKPIFSIKWGPDFFYSSALIKDDEYLRIVRNKKITTEARELVQRHKINKVKGTARIEANLEIVSEQHAYFDLIHILIEEMHQPVPEADGGAALGGLGNAAK